MIATMNTVWDRTAEFLSDNLAALMPIVLLGIFVPLTVFGSIMPLMGTAGPSGNATLGIALLVLSLLTSWAGLAITALAFDPAAGRSEALRTATQRFLPLVAISLVMLLIMVALFVPVGIALGFSGIDMASFAAGKPPAGTINGGAVAFMALYTIVLMPVLVFVYARFFVLITPIVVMERRGLGVFARSFVLTRAIGWKVVGLAILYVVVSSVAGMAAKAVFGSIFALVIGDDGVMSLAHILTQIIVSSISTIFSVLAVAFIAKLYLATRDAREAIVEAA